MTTMRNGRPAARRGAVAVLAAICLIPMIAVMAMAIDAGALYAQRRGVQAAADAAAYAAACVMYTNDKVDNGLDPRGLARAAALSYSSANGYADGASGNVVTVNVPPTTGPNAGKAGNVEVIVRHATPRFFSTIWGSTPISVAGRAVARSRYPTGSTSPANPAYGGSILLLDVLAAKSLYVAGSAAITAPKGTQVNSINALAARLDNNGSLTGPLSVVGSLSLLSGLVTGLISLGAPSVADPLASLTPPDPSTMTARSSPNTYQAVTINPGVYNNGLNMTSGGMKVTMNPGVYYVKGGFSIGNGVDVTGAGVTIYMDSPSSSFSIQGGGNVSLSAPTSGSMAGMVVYQNNQNSLLGGLLASSFSIANGTSTKITGTVYAKNAAINIAGGASTNVYGSQIIARTLVATNNAKLSVNAEISLVAQKPSSSTPSQSGNPPNIIE